MQTNKQTANKQTNGLQTNKQTANKQTNGLQTNKQTANKQTNYFQRQRTHALIALVACQPHQDGFVKRKISSWLM